MQKSRRFLSENHLPSGPKWSVTAWLDKALPTHTLLSWGVTGIPCTECICRGINKQRILGCRFPTQPLVLDEINLGRVPFPGQALAQALEVSRDRNYLLSRQQFQQGEGSLLQVVKDLLLLGALFLPASHGLVPRPQGRLAGQRDIPSGEVCLAFL